MPGQRLPRQGANDAVLPRGLKEAGADRAFQEKRPPVDRTALSLIALLDRLRPGDIVEFGNSTGASLSR